MFRDCLGKQWQWLQGQASWLCPNQEVSLLFRSLFGATAEERREPSAPIQLSEVCSCPHNPGQSQLTPLVPVVWSWMLEKAWEDPHPRPQLIHLTLAQQQWFNFYAATLKGRASYNSTDTDSWGWSWWVTHDMDQWLWGLSTSSAEIQTLNRHWLLTAICILLLCATTPANYVGREQQPMDCWDYGLKIQCGI